MSEELKKEIAEARNHITHGTDGPITPFVLMSRAFQAVGTWKHEVCANALHEELTERGWLVDEADAVEETGS